MQNKMPPVHPGEILREELEGLNISATAFAKSLGVPTNRITEILKDYFGYSPAYEPVFWNLG